MFAFVKKGSRPSLIASSAVATCLLAAVWQMGVYQQAGMGIAMGERRHCLPEWMICVWTFVLHATAAWFQVTQRQTYDHQQSASTALHGNACDEAQNAPGGNPSDTAPCLQ